MCFTPVLFTKWNDCIFHSKQGQNQDPAFSHMLFIGQKIVPTYVFVGQFCLFTNLQIFISFIEIIFLPNIYVVNVMFAIHFLKLHAICFQMRPNTKYLMQKFLVWGKAEYCYVKISRLSARQFVPRDQIRRNAVCACAGNAGNVFPTTVGLATHVVWCMPGSLTSGFLWSRWRGKRSRIPGACATRNFMYLVS